MDGALPTCERAADCDDGLFCNGAELCAPGADADARGCIAAAAPCALDQVCEESTDSCQTDDCEDPDEDGDGRNRVSCGGDDCDDEDADRFPGNVEVCDAAHDEDCDPSTLGGTDADGDGAVSAMCCNGVACGPDCDDSNPGVGPLVDEVCNGVDDDCDGTTDTSAEPLCPGGLCTSGSCRLDEWERAFGSTARDGASGVIVDGAGQVSVVAGLSGAADLGAASPVVLTGPALIRYAADGQYSWHEPLAQTCTDVPGGAVRNHHLSADGQGGLILAECCEGDVPPGGSGRLARTTVTALDGNGTVRWTSARLEGCGAVSSLSADGSRVVLPGLAFYESDLGGGEQHVPEGADGFVVELDVASGSYASSVWLQGPGREAVRFAARDSAGGLLLAVDVGLEPSGLESCVQIGAEELCSDRAHTLFARVTGSGALDWSLAIEAANLGAAVRSPLDDSLVASLQIQEPVQLPSGALTPTGIDAVLVHITSSGSLDWHRHLSSPGTATVAALDADSSGVVAASGVFTETVTLGGSPRGDGGTDIDAFVAWYAASGSHIGDLVLGGDGFDVALGVGLGQFNDMAIAGRFEGTVELGTSTYTSAGESDAFVIRRSY